MMLKTWLLSLLPPSTPLLALSSGGGMQRGYRPVASVKHMRMLTKARNHQSQASSHQTSSFWTEHFPVEVPVFFCLFLIMSIPWLSWNSFYSQAGFDVSKDWILLLEILLLLPLLRPLWSKQTHTHTHTTTHMPPPPPPTHTQRAYTHYTCPPPPPAPQHTQHTHTVTVTHTHTHTHMHTQSGYTKK